MRLLRVLPFAVLSFLSPLTAQHGLSPEWEVDSVPIPRPSADYRVFTNDGVCLAATHDSIYFFYKLQYQGGGSTGPIIPMVARSADGLVWTTDTVTVAQNTPGIFYIGAVADQHDRLHYIWTGMAGRQLYYALYDPSTGSWSSPETLATADAPLINAISITVDRKDRIHVMWNEGQTSDPTRAVEAKYRRNPGTGWEPIVALSAEDGRSSAFPRADFSGTSSDTLAIVFRDSVGPGNWDVVLNYSLDGGATWLDPQTQTLPTALGHPQSLEWDPGLVVDKRGWWHLHCHVYPAGNYLDARMMAGYSKNPPQVPTNWEQISPQGIRSQLSVYAYDPDNDRIWISWKDERDFMPPEANADVAIKYFDIPSETWGPFEFATDLGDEEMGFKKIAVSPGSGTVHVTFELPSTNGAYYKQRKNTLTALDPAPP
ncbi:MAG: hypothetical protein D6765_17140, partial [Bacteroidetes bacterium]